MDRRKKLQRQCNKMMRRLNRNIEQDDLWRGRFYLTQAKTDYRIYEDGSGEELYVTFVAVDKKTGVICPAIISSLSLTLFHGSKIWEFMNWFIVEYVDAWKDDPRKDKTDYNKAPRLQVDYKDVRKQHYWWRR